LANRLTVHIRERTIIWSVSYGNRYWVYRIDRIVSASIVSANIMCVTADLAAVNTGRITQEIKGHLRPVTHRAHGLEGGGRETVTWYQPSRDTKTVQYWVLATSDRWCRTPSTCRNW